MANKLTQEELDKFISVRQSYFDLKDQIADIAINEERIKNQKLKALHQIEITYDELTSIHDDIRSKYGEGKVNLQTGEVNP